MLTKKSKRSKGFTLVELLVTIAILSVLATVSVVGYISFIEKSAVSTDNYLVTQLNDLARLYEIEHTGSFEESDVRKLLKNAGITSLELKSESYDYRLYFNQNNNKFILTTEDYSNDEKYLLIDDGFLSEVDSGNMGEGNEGEGDNNTGEVNPPTSGDQEEENNNSQSNIIFVFNENYTDHKEVKLGGQKYLLNCSSILDTIYLSNVIKYNDEDPYILSYYSLNINEIISILDHNGDKLPVYEIQCIPIQTIDYYNYNPKEITHIDNDKCTIAFYKTGIYSLIIKATEDIYYAIDVYVSNEAYQDPEENSVSGSDIYNPKFEKNSDGTKDIGLELFLQVSITDIDNTSMNLITETENEYIESLIDNKKVIAQVESKTVQIELFKNKYCVIVDNLTNGKHSIELTITYVGCNGNIVTVTQNIVLTVNDSQVIINSIKEL